MLGVEIEGFERRISRDRSRPLVVLQAAVSNFERFELFVRAEELREAFERCGVELAAAAAETDLLEVRLDGELVEQSGDAARQVQKAKMNLLNALVDVQIAAQNRHVPLRQGLAFELEISVGRIFVEKVSKQFVGEDGIPKVDDNAGQGEIVGVKVAQPIEFGFLFDDNGEVEVERQDEIRELLAFDSRFDGLRLVFDLNEPGESSMHAGVKTWNNGKG